MYNIFDWKNILPMNYCCYCTGEEEEYLDRLLVKNVFCS